MHGESFLSSAAAASEKESAKSVCQSASEGAVTAAAVTVAASASASVCVATVCVGSVCKRNAAIFGDGVSAAASTAVLSVHGYVSAAAAAGALSASVTHIVFSTSVVLFGNPCSIHGTFLGEKRTSH